MNARECVDWVWGRWVYVPWARPRAWPHCRSGKPCGSGKPCRSQKPWSGWVECPKHPQREETRARAALRKSPGPLMAARRCDGRHIKQALSPHQGEAIWVGEQVGGSGTLGSVRLGARSPMLWPKYLDDIEG